MSHEKIHSPRPRSVHKYFLFFCVITVAIISLILAVTTGPKTWHAMKEMRVMYMFLALFLGLFMIAVYGLIIVVLTHASGKKIGFLYSLETVLSYFFLSSITPTLTGGEPLLIYMLTKKKIPLGKATSIALVRGTLVLSVIAVIAPIIILFRGDLVENAYLRQIFNFVAIVIACVVALIFYSILNPTKSESMIHRLFRLIGRIKRLKRVSEKIEGRLDTWIGEFTGSLKKLLKQKKKYLMLAVVLTVISIGANYLIAYVVLRGLNVTMPPLQVIMIQFVLYFLLYFAPTPGGAGIVEGGSYLIFAPFVPDHVLGIFIILWRFFTVYLWVLVGGGLVTKMIGFDIIEKVSSPGGKKV